MLGGRMVWVGMSRGRFVGGRNVKAPIFVMLEWLISKMWIFFHIIFGHICDDIDDFGHICDDQLAVSKTWTFCHMIFSCHVCVDQPPVKGTLS
jgi:hypothetical protein